MRPFTVLAASSIVLALFVDACTTQKQVEFDITTVHSKNISFESIPPTLGSADTRIFLTASVVADKNGNENYRASIWECVGAAESAEIFKNLHRGIVYKATY